MTAAPSSSSTTGIPQSQGSTPIGQPGGFLQTAGQLNPDIRTYANEVATARNVPLPVVENVLMAAQYDATSARLMSPAKTTRIRRSWVTYRGRFVDPIRIKGGAEFWAEHRSMLDRAARTYGVPQSIIVAILGVETIYGRNTGNFRVLDALATLGFRYPDPARPERAQLFRDQLADLIQLHQQGWLNAFEAEGSFAGAMGLPQFMPGSLLRYAVDGDEDGRIDLLASPDDAIASVANFLRQHGWVPGLPVFAPATLPPGAGKLVKGGLEPTYDWPQLEALGARSRTTTVRLASAQSGATDAMPLGAADTSWQQYKLGIVDLVDEPRKTVEYRVGTPNFFAITHYNRSYFYAASVADLASALADRMGYGDPNGWR